MKAHSVKKIGACLLLVAHLCSCVGLDTGDSSSSSNESQSVGDGASVNQPETVVVSGGGANVDASNRPTTVESDADELLEASPCESLLWKPISESDGNLAILSDFGDVRQWSSVTVYDATEGEVEFCRFSGLTPEADRQIWRCSQPGEFYTGEFDIEFSGEKCSGQVEDPSARND
jgi:hypothetical protein